MGAKWKNLRAVRMRGKLNFLKVVENL